MAIVRTYCCDLCGAKFDKLHFDRSEPPPPCPGCEALQARQVPAGFAITGSKSKAVDITQNIVEKDYGLTDMRDNLREGDIAAPRLPTHLQPAVDKFFSASGGLIAAAKQGAAEARSMGRNPLTMLQSAEKASGMPSRVLVNPVNRVR